MSTPHPHSATDLALAPVLIGIERNLTRVRECEDLEYEFALQLNDDDRRYHSPAERAGRIVQVATREVPLHGWEVHPTADVHGLAVEHSGYRVSVMLGSRLVEYIKHGTPGGYFSEDRAAARG